MILLYVGLWLLMIVFGQCYNPVNEPIAKLLLPDFWGFQPYVPASTATLKFASVCYFMYGAIKKAME